MNYKKEAIKLAKEIAKTRDKYTCQRCGKKNCKIDGSHILPVTYGQTAANPDNIIALCVSCHTLNKDSWHQNPLGQDWFHKKYPGKYEKLRKLALPNKPIKKYEWEVIYKKLKSMV